MKGTKRQGEGKTWRELREEGAARGPRRDGSVTMA